MRDAFHITSNPEAKNCGRTMPRADGAAGQPISIATKERNDGLRLSRGPNGFSCGLGTGAGERPSRSAAGAQERENDHAGSSLYGGGTGTNLFANGGGVDAMYGGGGINLFYTGANDTVHGGGTVNYDILLADTVSLKLGNNDIQEILLHGGSNAVDMTGATGAVAIYGANGSDTLMGGSGNDYLWGGGGLNVFAFQQNWGADTVMDWTAGAFNVLDLTALSSSGVHSMADLSIAGASGSDVITSSHTGTNSITLYGFTGSLTAANIKFG